MIFPEKFAAGNELFPECLITTVDFFVHCVLIYQKGQNVHLAHEKVTGNI